MSEKIIGYILLVLGVGLIIFSGVNIISVFSGSGKPVQLFNFSSISINLGPTIPEETAENLPPEFKESLKQIGSENKQEILPAETLNKTSNILAHIILMGFIVNIGFKLASLGTMLIRPIKVKLKSSQGNKPNQQ